MRYASSAMSTWRAARSGSLNTAIDVMSSSRSVRITRTAISPRLAMSTRRIFFTPRARSSFDHHARDRESPVVREGEVGRAAAERLEALKRDATERERRLPAARLHHFDLRPPHAAAHAGPEGVRRRFLRGETRRVVGQRVLVALAVL